VVAENDRIVSLPPSGRVDMLSGQLSVIALDVVGELIRNFGFGCSARAQSLRLVRN
jgi:hypothetical protein